MRPSARLTLILAATAAGVVASAWAGPSIAKAAPAPEGEGAAEVDAKTKAKAKKHAKAGSASFRDGDYEAALVDFEAASKLLPAPKLDYNIAVCHHRLMLTAEDEETRNYHNDHAIEAYNRYLEGKPDAPDRLEVAQTVRDLGGTPATFRGLKSAFEGYDDVVEEEDELALPEGEDEGGEDEAETETEEADPPLEQAPTEPEPEQPPPPQPQPTERYHARFYFGPHIGITPQLVGNQDVAGAGMLMAEGQAGGYLGKRHRALIGTEFALYLQNGTGDRQLAFSGGHVGFTADYDFPVGKKHRTVLAGGGMAGFSRQAIRETETAVAPSMCSEGEEANGRRVSARHGGVLGARFRVGILFGRRRWHEVNFALHPNLGIYGRGAKGADCSMEDTEFPFQNLGVSRYLLSIWAGFGYAFRF